MTMACTWAENCHSFRKSLPGCEMLSLAFLRTCIVLAPVVLAQHVLPHDS